MRSFLLQFNRCIQLLRDLPPAPAPTPADQPPPAAAAGSSSGDAVMAEPSNGGGAGGSSSAADAEATAAAAGTTPADLAEAYRQSVESTAGTFLVLMTNMSHAPMLINSPNSTNLITAAVPGAGKQRGLQDHGIGWGWDDWRVWGAMGLVFVGAQLLTPLR